MQQIADDVWQLRGFPRDMFNVYLLGDVLIDTGTRWARRRIVRQLGDRRISLVALTHCHPDHQGSARAICTRNGVPLACHEADVTAMEGTAPMVPNNGFLRWANRFWAGPAHPVERVLREGDEVAGFRVVHAPGHTPGHIMFVRERDRVVIAGDVLANIHFITREVGLREPPPAFSHNFVQNRDSIRRLLSLKPSIAAFGHGPVLRDVGVLERFVARLRA
jgi:glyoxylase-like metal-dependent hydrolase (beta-lactamase superfamily II)